MKQETRNLRRAAALLITAAALPLTPLAAQEAQQPTPEPFAVEVPARPVVSAPVEVTIPEPEATAPPAAAEPAPVVAARAPARVAQRRAPARAAPARPAPARAAAPVRAPAPAPAPVAEAASTVAAPAPAPAPAEAVPPPVAPPPAASAPPPAAEPGSGFNPLWLILGALALGAAALFLLIRRRRHAAYDETEAYEEAPALAAPAAVVAEVPVAEEGRPALDLALRPVRAGVTGEDAVVEFELEVDNHGTAAARDVRVSTWMFAAGGSEAEQALIDHGDGQALPAIAPGTVGHVASTVTLPTASVESDAVLPVVVAEARYRLPDGSEACTSATYAVGVPDGEELAHFAIDNPSGLHDEVVAWKMGETENA